MGILSVSREQMAKTFSMDASTLISTLCELKSAYRGFEWESERWEKEGHQRSPYRALVLFGLSPRTRDSLLVDMCRQFFRRFPDGRTLARQGGDIFDDLKSIVRQGQVPFVISLAQVLAERQAVPMTVEELLKIRGVGHKIADCVLAYGWGHEAVPLDANVYRVLCRIQKTGGRDATASTSQLRELLKCSHQKHRPEFAAMSIAMVDIHEILRLHGQVCCTRKPDCAACPVSNCGSRLASMDPPMDLMRSHQITPAIWDDWRELLLEPKVGRSEAV